MRKYREMYRLCTIAPHLVEEMVFMFNVFGIRGPQNILSLVLVFIGKNALPPLFGWANTKIKM